MFGKMNQMLENVNIELKDPDAMIKIQERRNLLEIEVKAVPLRRYKEITKQ